MRRTLRLSLLAALLSQLGGCFFFFIPGSVTSAIGDSITGAKGEHCVAETAQIGDKIKAPNGSLYEVKSLSGKSTRCTNAFMPIRAELVTVAPPPPQQ